MVGHLLISQIDCGFTNRRRL